MNTPSPILIDSKGRTARYFPIVIGNAVCGRMLRRCDANGIPLIRLRASKKLRRRLRAAGYPHTKWLTATVTDHTPAVAAQ